MTDGREYCPHKQSPSYRSAGLATAKMPSSTDSGNSYGGAKKEPAPSPAVMAKERAWRLRKCVTPSLRGLSYEFCADHYSRRAVRRRLTAIGTTPSTSSPEASRTGSVMDAGAASDSAGVSSAPAVLNGSSMSSPFGPGRGMGQGSVQSRCRQLCVGQGLPPRSSQQSGSTSRQDISGKQQAFLEVQYSRRCLFPGSQWQGRVCLLQSMHISIGCLSR